MDKSKHNKIKNTGILFEILTRQITADMINGNDGNSVAKRLIETYFRKNSALGREYFLYQTLLKNKFPEESKAHMLVNEVLNLHKKINKTELKNSKYNLIREIKENFNVIDFFNTRIEDYKTCASIYKLLEAKSEEYYSASDVVESKSTIIEHITSKNKKNMLEEESPILKEYETMSKDIKLLTYKSLVNKFNDKYKSLNENQKTLLKRYINHVTNSENLSDYLHECAETVQSELRLLVERIENKVTKIKVNEVINQLTSFGKRQNPSDDEVLAMMNIYELVDEIKAVVEKHDGK